MGYVYRDVDALAHGDRQNKRVAGNRVEKRLQKSKNIEVVFDDASRREYLTGFRKRKKQRREDAAKKIAVKEKKQRAEERAHRRQEIKQQLGLPDDYGVANSSDDEEAEDKLLTSKARVATYQTSGTVTTVRCVALDSDGEEVKEEEPGDSDDEDASQDDDQPPTKQAKAGRSKQKVANKHSQGQAGSASVKKKASSKHKAQAQTRRKAKRKRK